MSTQDSRGGAAGLRDRRVARVLDREISPVWHDRFGRLIVRNLPALPEVLALEIHCGTGRGTSELLHRLGAGAKVLAIDPDEGALELAKTRIRSEWKNRVYFKAGHFDDVTAMADDSYNLVVANLVLGESVDLGPAIGEMIRVCKIGGRILATVPLHGTWDEVEDIFAEILRDAGLTAALRRLEALRAIRPTGPQLGKLLRKLGCVEDDYVIEQERFQLLFPSGREFLFAPVIEHGPLQMWKAVIGKDGAPQELFWRLKEAIDAYYAGHVLAVTVNAGLVHVEVAKGTTRPGPRLAARFWRHYPELDKLWGGLAVGYARVSDPILPFSDDDLGDFDLDIDLDESDPRRRTGAVKALKQPTSRQPAVETPSPEEFGLRFRPRDNAESSGTRPVDAESSGARPKSPASEASGLRALSQMRDAESSATRPAAAFRPVPLPADEDDFSELNRSESQPGPEARSGRSGSYAVEPDAEDDFSALNDELALKPPSESSGRRPLPDAESSGRRPLPDAETNGRRPLPDAETSGHRPLPDAETSGRRPLPDTDGESSSRRAVEALRSETQDIPRVAAESTFDPPRSGPSAEARRTPSGPAAEARPVASDLSPGPASSTRPTTSDLSPGSASAEPELASGPDPSAPATDSDLSSGTSSLSTGERAPQSDPDLSPRPTLASRLAGAPETERLSPFLTRVDAPAEHTPLPRPVFPAKTLPPRSDDESVTAQPRRSGEPVETPKPSVPTFRLPDPRPTGGGGSVGGVFRPPTFRPPTARDEEAGTPIKNMFRPPPKPAAEDDEPEEIDELEPVEELEEQPKPAAAKPPPPRMPPPPRPPKK